VAFFGCCGSWFQSRCMLITVSSCLHIIVLRGKFQSHLLIRILSFSQHTCKYTSVTIELNVLENYNVPVFGKAFGEKMLYIIFM
jgi:hypothetical protein